MAKSILVNFSKIFVVLIAISKVIIAVELLTGKSCEFNGECECVEESKNVYSKVSCLKVDHFPKFKSIQSDVTVREFLIEGKIVDMPQTGLDAFHHIDHVVIKRDKDDPYGIEGEGDYTLANCSIDALTLIGFAPKLLPLSRANVPDLAGLSIDPRTLAALSKIRIEQSTISLADNSFSGASKLKSLSMSNNAISDRSFIKYVSPFKSIADTLIEFEISHTTLETYQRSFDDLTHLETLRLNDNNMKHISASDIASKQNLTFLDLSRNKELIEFDGRSINNEHLNLRELYLADCSLEDVQAETLKHFPSLHILSMPRNKITNLTARAFEKNTNVNSLILDGNPIDRVEIEAFDNLQSVKIFSIFDWQIETLDLSVFKGSWFESVKVQNNTRLHTLNVSDFTVVPSHLRNMTISGNNLTAIDSSVKQLLERDRDLTITISNENHFDCHRDIDRTLPPVLVSIDQDVLVLTGNTTNGTNPTEVIVGQPQLSLMWLAQKVVCEYRIVIRDDVFCAVNNNETVPIKVYDFLQSLNPNCTGFETTTLLTLKPTSPRGTPTTSSALSYRFFDSLLLFFVGLLIAMTGRQ